MYHFYTRYSHYSQTYTKFVENYITGRRNRFRPYKVTVLGG